MEMTFMAFIVGLLLAALPFGIVYIYKVNIGRQLLAAMAQMMAVAALTGVFLHYAFKWDSPWLNLLFFALMVVLGAAASAPSKPLKGASLLPVLAGMSAATLAVGGWLLLVVAMASGWQASVLDARWLLPIAGLLTGSLVTLNARALSAYYKGFEHHSALYYYLLGNGASRAEAEAYLVRRALQRAALPVVRQMARLMVSQAPVVVWTMLLSGIGVWTAVAWQVLLLVAVLAAAMLSVAVALWVARKQLTINN